MMRPVLLATVLASPAAHAFPFVLSADITSGTGTDFESCDADTADCGNNRVASATWYNPIQSDYSAGLSVFGGAASTVHPSHAFFAGSAYAGIRTSYGALGSATFSWVATITAPDGTQHDLVFPDCQGEYSGGIWGPPRAVLSTTPATKAVEYAGVRYQLRLLGFGTFFNEHPPLAPIYYYVFSRNEQSYAGNLTRRAVWNGSSEVVLTANAGDDLLVDGGELVELYGTGRAPPFTTTWSQSAGPAVTLVDDTQPTASFEAPYTLDGTTLAFTLTTAVDGLSATDTVVVDVAPCTDADDDASCDVYDLCEGDDALGDANEDGICDPALDASEVIPGAPLTLSVDGVPPGASVWFAATNRGLGQGPCYAPLSLCFDLPGGTYFGAVTAGSDGSATIIVYAPARLRAGRTLYFQAGWVDAAGDSGGVTEVVERQVQARHQRPTP